MDGAPAWTTRQVEVLGDFRETSRGCDSRSGHRQRDLVLKPAPTFYDRRSPSLMQRPRTGILALHGS